MSTNKYRLLTGGHGKDGIVYKANREGYPNEVELTDDEAERLKGRVAPIGSKAVKAPVEPPKKVAEVNPPAPPLAPLVDPPAVKPPAPVVETPLGGNVGQARVAIAKMDDVAELKALKAEEAAGKNRTTVLQAIDERIARIEEAS